MVSPSIRRLFVTPIINRILLFCVFFVCLLLSFFFFWCCWWCRTNTTESERTIDKDKAILIYVCINVFFNASKRISFFLSVYFCLTFVACCRRAKSLLLPSLSVSLIYCRLELSMAPCVTVAVTIAIVFFLPFSSSSSLFQEIPL